MKAKKLLIWLLVGIMCLAVVACTEEPVHEHSYAAEWSYDGTDHWHACTGEGCTEVGDKAAHAWDSGVVTTEATHTADGVKTYTCECGATKTEAIAKGEHTWDEGVVTKEPTFTEEGVKTYTCECGETKTESIPKSEHDWDSEWTTDNENHWHICKTEGCEEISDKAAHDFDEGVVVEPASAGVDGKTKYTCKTCGYSKTLVVHIEIKDVTEALNTYFVGDVSFAMTENVVGGFGAFINGDIYAMPVTDGEVSGNGTWVTADNDFITGGLMIQTESNQSPEFRVYLPKIDFTQYKLVSIQMKGAPDAWGATISLTTVKEEGIEAFSDGTLTFVYNSETETLTATLTCGEQVKVLDIIDEDIISGNASFTFEVWGAAAYRGIYVGQVMATKTETTTKEYLDHAEHLWSTNWTKDETDHWHICTADGCSQINDKAAHEWGEGEITTAPTHTAEGVKTYTCVCGATKTEVVPVTAHEWATTWSKDETNHWYICTIEGCTEKKDNAVHTWNAGEITTAPTYDAAGEKTYTCTACGATKTEPVGKLNHTWATTYSKDETHHWYDCTDQDCFEIKDKAEHTWNAGEITTPTSYDAAGEKTYTCTVCGATKTEPIAQLVHSYADTYSKNETHHWYACTDAGYTDLKKDEAEHDFNAGEVLEVATIGKDGKKKYTCETCGYEKLVNVHIDAELKDVTLNTYVETPATVTNAIGTYQAYVNGGIFAMPVTNGNVSGNGTWTTNKDVTLVANGLEIQTQQQNSAQYRVYLPLINYTMYESVSMQIVGGPDTNYANIGLSANRDDSIFFSTGTLTFAYDSTTSTLNVALTVGSTTKTLAITDADIINGTKNFTFDVWGGAAYRSIYVGQITAKQYVIKSAAVNTYGDTNELLEAVGTYKAWENGGVYAMPVTDGAVSGDGTWVAADTNGYIANGLEMQTQMQNNAQYRVFLPKIDFTKYLSVSVQIKGGPNQNYANIGLTADKNDSLYFTDGTLAFEYDSATATLNVALSCGGNVKTLAITDSEIINGTKSFSFDVWGNAAYHSTYIGQIMAVQPTETPISE